MKKCEIIKQIYIQLFELKRKIKNRIRFLLFLNSYKETDLRFQNRLKK